MAQTFHMIGYIHESPQALKDTLRENVSEVQKIVQLARSRRINKLVLSGLGSSYTSAMMALPLCQRFCELQTIVLQPNDIDLHLGRFIDAHTLIVMVSRSGERGGVVESLLEARKHGALGVAITGVADSLLAQNAELHCLHGKAQRLLSQKQGVTACTG